MNKILKDILRKAKEKNKEVGVRVILTEPDDDRVLKAASIITKKAIAEIIIIGNPKKIIESANKKRIKLDFSKIKIIDHLRDPDFENIAKKLHGLRKNKGLTLKKAVDALKDPIYYACMMLKEKKAEGIVSGASHITSDTWRPALQIIKTKKGFASSSFLMLCKLGKKERPFVFGDCALNIMPNSKELAMIAQQSAQTFKFIVGENPRVALVSFSTKGSGYGESLKRIKDACKVAKKENKNLVIEGEVQLDEAIIPKVANIKCPTCTIKGDANVIIFPDLNSGNIGYKLVERFGNAKAIGPIIQGLNKPVNDLSRGCSVDDIVNLVAITVLQVKK